MDVACCNCGEPWEAYYLWHDLKKEVEADPEGVQEDGWKFGSSPLVVLHCPCCPKDGSGLQNAGDRAQNAQTLADLLGDDEDGLAAALEDYFD